MSGVGFSGGVGLFSVSHPTFVVCRIGGAWWLLLSDLWLERWWSVGFSSLLGVLKRWNLSVLTLEASEA